MQSFSKKDDNLEGSICSESSWTSIKVGHPPRYRTAFAGAINVKLGRTTSSPASTPAIFKATWRAAVPLEVATAPVAPTFFANSSSNLVTKLPTDDTHPVSKHSRTNSHSWRPMLGILKGMKFILVQTHRLHQEQWLSIVFPGFTQLARVSYIYPFSFR